MGFRAGEPVTSDWLPRIDDAARALRLPNGEHGYILQRGQRAFGVSVQRAQREQTLEKLTELAQSRALRVEKQP